MIAKHEQMQHPDHSEPSERRKEALHAASQEGSEAPYQGVEIRTLGELDWIFWEREWSGEFGLNEDMARPNLSGASIAMANLSGTYLKEANVSKTNFTRALLDVETNLDDVSWTDPPILLGVRWNGAPLDGIHWEPHQRLGDEQAIQRASSRVERITAYRDAIRANHGLVVALESQGLAEPARRYRQRERTLERHSYRVRPRTWGRICFIRCSI